MLWIGVCEVASIAATSGLIGGCLMALAYKQTNKFNMKVMESYWNADIKRLESQLACHDHKISTISVGKAVNNQTKTNNNKGYKHSRHFDQRG